jgi:hypothetical protein
MSRAASIGVLTRSAAALLGLVVVLRAPPALAIDKIYSPQVVQGEAELEYFGTRTFDPVPDQDNLQDHEISIGYGVTDFWAPELYALLERTPDQSVRISGMEIENRFQLAPAGKYWLDPGLLVAYTWPTQSEDPSTLEVKLLLEKLTGRILNRVNIGGEQEFGHNSHGSPDRVILWSTRYLLDPRLAPGFEIQSDFGRADEASTFNEQQHYVGPAAYGEIIPHLKYEVAYLFGVSTAASKSAVRLLLEYEAFF